MKLLFISLSVMGMPDKLSRYLNSWNLRKVWVHVPLKSLNKSEPLILNFQPKLIYTHLSVYGTSWTLLKSRFFLRCFKIDFSFNVGSFVFIGLWQGNEEIVKFDVLSQNTYFRRKKLFKNHPEMSGT